MMKNRLGIKWKISPAVWVIWVAFAKPVWAETQEIGDVPPGMGALVPPNVMLALSVEYPTAGTAYPAENGFSVPTLQTPAQFRKRYLGYFDSNKCYRYNSSKQYFEPIEPTRSTVLSPYYQCREGQGLWSGNILNWMTMSAIDVFRHGMTGGNRAWGRLGDINAYAKGDTEDLTILRRANIVAGQNQDHGFSPVWLRRRVIKTSGISINLRELIPFKTADGRADISSTEDYFTVHEKGSSSYKAAVQVCVPGKLESNCRPFIKKDGKVIYKPIGLIQANANQMRFGVMSYLDDQSNRTQGGVLRARIKPTNIQSDVVGNSGTRFTLGAEWSAETGQFALNPDMQDAKDSGVVRSGVVNHINQFGDVGKYKKFDPAAELYYAGLRYFRNIGNYGKHTEQAKGREGGFPVITDWDDPIRYTCQKNYIIYMGDTQTHHDVNLPGGGNASTDTQGYKPQLPNDDYAFSVSSILLKLGITNRNVGQWNSPPYIAALAYWGNTEDIRPEKDVNGQEILPGNQHVKAFMIDVVENGEYKNSLENAFYLAGKFGGFTDKNNNKRPDLLEEWRDPNTFLKPFIAGVPTHYAAANDPQRMLDALKKALEVVAMDSSQSFSGLGSSSKSVSPNKETYVYQGGYHVKSDLPESGMVSAQWSGFLNAVKVTVNGTESTPTWSAEDLLDARLTTNAEVENRRVWTWQRSENKGRQFTTQQMWLKDYLNADGFWQQRVSYLRGSREHEQPDAKPFFKPRISLLGDIIHSAPLYIPSQTRQPNECAKVVEQRSPLVVVGANDGFMHIFHAETGQEVLSYLPQMHLRKMNEFTDPASSHHYWVDGSVQAASVCLGTKRDPSSLVLLGNTGRGGRGLFALDIGKIEGATPEQSVLWEFSDQDDPALGIVVGQPVLAKAKIHGQIQYVAMVGNGVNARSTTDEANLFVLSLSKKNGPWILGKNYWRLKVGGANSEHIRPNALISPLPVDINGDGLIDYVYAGDLNGRMWKFDLSQSDNPDRWHLEKDAQGRALPFFVAEYQTKNKRIAQPIGAQPLAIRHKKGLMLIFGTGKLLSDRDLTLKSPQALYGVYDGLDGLILGENAQLTAYEVIPTFVMGKGKSQQTKFQTIQKKANTSDGKDGWQITLPIGERAIYPAQSVHRRAQFVTMRPTEDACQPGGESWVTEVDLITGAQANFPIYDTNGDGKIDAQDKVVSRHHINGMIGPMLNIGTPTGSFAIYGQGNQLVTTIRAGQGERRLSWREILGE